MATPTGDLRKAIDAILDGVASDADFRFVEQAAAEDPTVVSMYVDAVNVHASMQWDYGSAGTADPLDGVEPNLAIPLGNAVPESSRSLVAASLLGLAALVVVGLSVFWNGSHSADQPVLVDNNRPSQATDATETNSDEGTGSSALIVENVQANPGREGDGDSPLRAMANADDQPKVNASAAEATSVADVNRPGKSATIAEGTGGEPGVVPAGNGDAAQDPSAIKASLVAFVDDRLEKRWTEEGLTPSPNAAPLAWLRRASLDLKGRIPTRSEIEAFLAVPAENRRDVFVADALESGDYADHFATVWSNLLVGRSSAREVNRQRLHGYLADAFAENRSWGDIAGELVSAEGPEQNPPTNFLLAHLNNEAVPATAITSRVLLGRQLQCTQCHSHPFNDWKQDQFWELNAFFQQCDVEEQQTESGRNVRVLVDRQTGGPTFFETRRGLMQVAYPIYGGERIDEAASVNRREELARLMVAGEKTDLAEAMVNRLWAHFMGAGFTLEIDDLGPHAAISHPEILDRLTRAFVASNYDVRQLVSWITGTAAYQLSADIIEGNETDRPEIGETPLFTRVYEKTLSPEQLYDSLVTATAGPRASVRGLPSRDQWVAEFYAAQDNEENGEMSSFDASPSVALELMNGRLVSLLVNSDTSVELREVLTMKASEDERLNALSLLVLGREPSGEEKKSLRRVLRPTIDAYAKELPRPAASQEGFRDLFWAYVNSSEFTVNR